MTDDLDERRRAARAKSGRLHRPGSLSEPCPADGGGRHELHVEGGEYACRACGARAVSSPREETADRRGWREIAEERNAELNRGPDGAPRRPKDRRKANLGKSWEAVLVAQHAEYRARGLADIDKIPTPAVPLEAPRARRPAEVARFGNGGPVHLARPQRGVHVDFEGVLGPTGQAVRLEAKSARVDRIELRQVADHQARSLRHCERLGGFAAVLVLLPSGMWAVPWMHWTPEGKKKSLSPDDLDRRGARFNDADIAGVVLAGASAGADWLRAVRARGWVRR